VNAQQASRGFILSRASKVRARTKVEAEEVDIEAAICSRVRAAIASGDLPPGMKLPEETFAGSFSTTRAHVRSAFQRLAFEGLVDLQKNRGAFIAQATVKEARDIFEARRAIERVTTEIVTRTLLTHQLRSLRDQVNRQKNHWLRGNRQLSISGISGFHLSLAALAHNTALTTALERLIIRTSLILGTYSTPRTFGGLAEFYDQLLDLIESGHSLAASRQIEHCLFAIEGELDFYPPQRPEVDLRRLMRTIG
jgi:DNA-binding GntR family transcriptional regulator